MFFFESPARQKFEMISVARGESFYFFSDTELSPFLDVSSLIFFLSILSSELVLVRSRCLVLDNNKKKGSVF